MGKNRHDRHGDKIKGDTPDLTCDGRSFEILIIRQAFLIMRHEHKIWDPCIPLPLYACIHRGLASLNEMDDTLLDFSKLDIIIVIPKRLNKYECLVLYSSSHFMKKDIID